MEWLWGLKTVAFFDAWSIEHVLSGISIGRIVKTQNTKKLEGIIKNENASGFLYFDMLGVLFLAYLWETIEHYLETGLLGITVEFWFQGVEMWGNRIITDPLLLVLGYYIVRNKPKWVIPARCLTALWLLIHIFVFPHSMYLHEIL